MPDAIIGSTTNFITSEPSTDAASARRARQEAEAIVPLSPASYANVAAAVAAALSTGRALQLRPGDAAVINVPAQVSTIGAAVTAIRNWAIPDGATLTINRTDSGETMTSSVTMDHPDGIRIFIYGNRTTPANCVLTASNENDILYVPAGCAIGGFDGFRLVKSGGKARIGVLTDGGIITCGPKLEVDNFYYGLAARYGGKIFASGTSTSNRVLVTNAGDVGIWAYNGSHISCRYALVEGASDIPNNLGFGIMGEHGGSIDAQHAIARTCYRAGIASYTASDVRAYDTTVEDNVGHGYDAYASSSLIAHSGISRRNGGWGANLDDTSTIQASPAITYTSNVSGDRIPRLERFFASQAGIRPEGGSGNDSLRIDARGTGSVFFNSGGGAQFQIDNAASAVNRLTASGAATGGQARLFAGGSDANVGVRIDSKGTGSVNLNTNGGTPQFQVDHTANAVNRVAVTGGATGAAARVLSVGADADVGLDLLPKGAGQVRMVGEAAGRGVNIIFTTAADTILRGVNPTDNRLRPLTLEAEDWTVKTGTTGDASAGTTRMRANTTGIGFFGVTPVARPNITGSRAGNAALASFLSSLASLGLITDGSTA